MDMWHPKRLIVAAVATVAIGLVLTFPARVAYQWFAPGDLKLSGIGGSVWRGNAAQGSAGAVYLTNVKWRVRPLALLTGKLAFATSSNPASGHLEADIALGIGGSITMSHVTGTATLASVADALPLNGMEGDVSLQLDALVIKNGLPVEATGTLNIANFVSHYISPVTLGDFQARFETESDGISGSVESLRGVLDLVGTIKLTQGRNYEIVGKVAAKQNAPAGIEQQLRPLGTPDARGMREFRMEGQL
jgi:general secretion pathway protein N